MKSTKRRTLYAPVREIEDDQEESKIEYSFDYELEHRSHKNDYMSTNLIYQPNIFVCDVSIEEVRTHSIIANVDHISQTH